ncbi:uncharacterized protein LOC118180394, partial [Stegodyphus dumicola]|uniref:uncharacterized protein LOC118180394 n=1 Tax=Stegodyphus dumicola TaxID=202533 RepID=UPI0015AAA3E1
AYCLVCVYSQYQEYVAGRGYPQARTGRPLPPAEYQRDGCSSSVTKITNDSMALTQQSSAPPGVSDATINSEYSSTFQNVEVIINGKEKEPIAEQISTAGETNRNSPNGIENAVYVAISENGGRIFDVSLNNEGEVPKEETQPFV